MVEYLDGGRIQGSAGDSLGSSADGVNTNVTLNPAWIAAHSANIDVDTANSRLDFDIKHLKYLIM